MIHSMRDCREKLCLIRDVARLGAIQGGSAEVVHRFNIIESEVNYLIREAEEDADRIRVEHLRSYRKD